MTTYELDQGAAPHYPHPPMFFAGLFTGADTDKYLLANGNSLITAALAPGGTPASQYPCPQGIYTTLSWASQTADGTTVLNIFVDGVSTRTVTLSGASGSIGFEPLSVAKGSKIEVRYHSGTAPGQLSALIS